MSCEHCIFSESRQSEPGIFYLLCRRFPPTPILRHGEIIYVSPKVERNATCGEEKHYE